MTVQRSNPAPPPTVAYFFLDEGGDLGFKTNGSKYFTLTCVRAYRPFLLHDELIALRLDLVESGHDIERFHAREDEWPIRKKVCNVIQARLADFRADCVVVEKRKTHPKVQDEQSFYPRMLGYLMRHAIAKTPLTGLARIVVMTDQLPLKKKRGAIEKAVKGALNNVLPKSLPYQLLHHDSRSCTGLQVADYVNWSIHRRWTDGKRELYDSLKPAIKSEFDIFRTGTTYFY